MEERFLPEGARPQPDHPRGGGGDPMDSPALVRDIAADRLEAFAAKELALPGDVRLPLEAVGIRAIPALFSEDRADDSERRVFREASQQQLEEILVERDVRIEVAHHVMLDGPHN